MAVTIKCADCGYARQSDDGDEETCPKCDGAMTAVKKSAAAKSAEEPRGKKKASAAEDDKPTKKAKFRDDEDDDDDRPKARKKSRADDDDDDDEKPRAKKKARDEDDDDDRPRKKSRADDDDDDDTAADFETDGKAAEQLDLNPGFKNRLLMKQIAKELDAGEVLHYACRPSAHIAKKQGMVAMISGGVFALIGVVVAVVMLTSGKDKVPTAAVLVPGFIVAISLLIAVLGPKMKARQARLGWYAVTDRRAIVFHISLWGTSGHAQTYSPAEVRKMWVKKSYWLKGGGDVVFKTVVTQHTTRTRDAHGRTRTSTSTSTEHFGFLGVADAKEVRLLIQEVLLTADRDDEDDD
jgi:hypothetical protein